MRLKDFGSKQCTRFDLEAEHSCFTGSDEDSAAATQLYASLKIKHAAWHLVDAADWWRAADLMIAFANSAFYNKRNTFRFYNRKPAARLAMINQQTALKADQWLLIMQIYI